MNNAKRNQSRFGIVLSGVLLAAAAFAVPGFFQNQKEAEVVENYYPAIPMAAAPSAPEVSSSTGSTTLYIQNKEALAGSVYVTFYQDSGASIDLTSCLVGTAGVTNTIPASGNLTLSYATCGSLASGSRGSSVVSSDVDVAVVDFAQYTPNNTANSTTGFASGGAENILPLVSRNFSGLSDTSLYVQNTESVTRTAVVEFYTQGLSGVAFSTTTSIPPYASKVYNLGTDSLFNTAPFTVAGGWRGSARVSGLGGVGLFASTSDVRINQLGLGSTNLLSQTLQGYSGTSVRGTVFYIPVIKRNAVGYTTNIQMLNDGASSANLTIQFTGGAATPASGSVTTTIAANGSVVYDQGKLVSGIYTEPPQATFGTYWEGTAIVTSSVPIVVNVRDNSRSNTGGRSTAANFSAFTLGQASNELFAPIVKRKFGTSLLSSQVRLQNLGATTIYARIEYFAGPGSPAISGAQLFDYIQIPPGELRSFNQGTAFKKDNTTFLPVGFTGSARIIGVATSSDTTPLPGALLVGIGIGRSESLIATDSVDQDIFELIKK